MAALISFLAAILVTCGTVAYLHRPPFAAPPLRFPTMHHGMSVLPSSLEHTVQVSINPPVFMQTAVGASRAGQPTPYVKYYMPTYKCDGGFFCRAELTAYEEFQGMTAIEVGYSVWSFSAPSTSIPASTTNGILGTSDADITAFMFPLGGAIASLYQNYSTTDNLCPLTPSVVADAYKEVISSMAECTKTENFVCQRTKTVARC